MRAEIMESRCSRSPRNDGTLRLPQREQKSMPETGRGKRGKKKGTGNPKHSNQDRERITATGLRSSKLRRATTIQRITLNTALTSGGDQEREQRRSIERKKGDYWSPPKFSPFNWASKTCCRTKGLYSKQNWMRGKTDQGTRGGEKAP